MNKFEHKNIIKSENEKKKRETFFRKLIKPVSAGANGTLNHVVKTGSGKNTPGESSNPPTS